jgi:hypothetical protein
MSPDARFMCGLSLILIPTIVYGGLTILGVISGGQLGTPGPNNLSTSQIAFYRAGHAHAGVLTLLALFIQVAADYAALPRGLLWPIRIGAIAASILVSPIEAELALRKGILKTTLAMAKEPSLGLATIGRSRTART